MTNDSSPATEKCKLITYYDDVKTMLSDWNNKF
jgi:hypothetical protein